MRKSASRTTRIGILLGALTALVGLYAATSGWRGRLMEESARSRRVIAEVEQARQARERRVARERALEAALQSNGGDVDARLELAQLRWAEAGPQAAVAVLEPAADRAADLRLLHMLASAQRLMGREDRALATLDRATRAAPRDGDAWAQRALILTLMGWFGEAKTALQAADQLSADPVRRALVAVTMARQHGDLRQARRILEMARQRYPEDAEVVKQLAAVAEKEDHIDEAAHLLASIAETEADPEVWTALARVYLQRTDPDARARAHSAAQRALALRPQMPSARLLLARSLRLQGDLKGAREVLEPLYRERPRQTSVAFELAQVYRGLGLKDRARPLMAQHQEALRRRGIMRRAALAVMTRPNSAGAHREIGRLCLERGMIGRAILSLQRAQSLDPRLPGVRDLLTRARAATPSRESGEDAGG